jgi:hypothetical protein
MQTGKFLEEYFDLGLHDLQKDDSLRHDGISCIYKDRSGTLWVGNTTGLHQINLTPKTGRPSEVSIKDYPYNRRDSNGLSGNHVGSIMEDRAGILWIGTNNGLNSFDRKTGL